MDLVKRAYLRLLREKNLFWHHRLVKRIAAEVKHKHNEPEKQSEKQPIIFFNASTRLSGLSQNAAFSLVSSLALRSAGERVIHFVCNQGLSHCVLGTDKYCPQTPPPCAECMRTSRMVFASAETRPFSYQRDEKLAAHIRDIDLKNLLKLEWQDIPLGKLVLPSLRWILRIHHLEDNEKTCYLAKEYILSAFNVVNQFEKLIQETNPKAVVVFNGMFYPEAAARWTAHKHGLPVYSHEVGMLPLSAFFTAKEATAYPVKVDESFSLSSEQHNRLDEYLSKRTKGKFITAGVKFWPEMRELDSAFWTRANNFEGLVPVFTNVIFDTSQGHANVVFEHMFAWLDVVLEEIKAHPEIFFIIRAHPDEERPGKESLETVTDWVEAHGVDQLPNVMYISPKQYISSYELIAHAKFVMVYNSTVGLEASVMGKPVLCAGKARYTQIPTVYFPKNVSQYRQLLADFLDAEKVEHPVEFQKNARRVLYSQLFRASLPFGEFIEDDGIWRGYIRMKNFHADDLTADKSSTIEVVLNGILNNDPFIMEL